MPAKKYCVKLSKTEHEELSALLNTGKVAGYKRRRAHILLKADTGPGGPGLNDVDIVTSIDVSLRTVERTRQRLVEQGLEKALEREKRQRSKALRLDGEQTREKLHMEPGKPERYDTEYERNGTSNLFIFFEPLRGWRRIDVTEQRTAKDWALQIKKLADENYPQATTIRLVMDNLNTHTGASLYKVFCTLGRRGGYSPGSHFVTRLNMETG